MITRELRPLEGKSQERMYPISKSEWGRFLYLLSIESLKALEIRFQRCELGGALMNL